MMREVAPPVLGVAVLVEDGQTLVRSGFAC